MSEELSFYSHGKLLLSGEYLVLDGALALAVPVKFGQSLEVKDDETGKLHWNAGRPGIPWFEASYALPGLELLDTSDRPKAEMLLSYFHAIRSLNPLFLLNEKGLRVKTTLEFEPEWGLGSSSTLIQNLAAWAEVDPYSLLWSVSKGSGYDVACASASGPVLYQLSGNKPVVTPVRFRLAFGNSIYFVYLGRKQNSEQEISSYHNKRPFEQGVIIEISDLTESMLSAASLAEFRLLMDEHESVISKILDKPRLNDDLFRDFPGSAKSLGAWGGDFAMLATDISPAELKGFLTRKELKSFFGFEDFVIQHPETHSL